LGPDVSDKTATNITLFHVYHGDGRHLRNLVVDLRVYRNARCHITKDHNHKTAVASVPLDIEF